MIKPKILVVDDDKSLLRLYESALLGRGYRVVCADNGEAALKLAETELPDLIIMDIMLPAIHGLHAIDILKATPSTQDIKIIILTSLGDETTKEKALKSGALDYIVKSQSNMAEILDKISGVL